MTNKVITTVTDSNSSKYSALFEAATTFLKENVGNFPNNGQGYEDRIEVINEMIANDASISSVQEYFSHLKDLLDLGGDKFLMLPLDEPYFEIDANKREIIIPAEFKKNGFGVRGDHTAENLIFKMPRFFDAMDLLNADIRIQWVDANKEEGMTRIDIIDAERDADYLYFMWPLTTAVTKNSGAIKFSVRFYILDATGLVYSYATKIATATINEGHNFDVAGWTGSIDHADDDFRANIRNSRNVGAESAADPFFIINLDNDVDRGWNADFVSEGPAGPVLEGYLDAENPQQVLAVEAGANDTGFIGYEWYYADQTVPSDQQTYKLVSEFDYLQVPAAEKVNPIQGKRYYKKDNGNYVAAAEFNEDTDLYERINKIVVEKGALVAEDGHSTQTLDHVVGIYQAVAKNSKNGNEATERSFAVRFPAPDVLEFAEDGDLSDYIYLNNNNQGQASVDVERDEHGAILTYIWEKAIDINGPLDRPAADNNFAEVYRSSESNSYSVTEPGIYRVQVISTRNFEDKVIYSNVSRIVAMPVVPTVLYPIEDVAVSSLNGNALLEARIAPINDALKSEDLTYQWFTDNNEPVEGASGDCGYDEYHSVYTAQLLVPEGTRMGYYCKIWNHVGEQKSEAITADFSVNPTKYDMPVGVNATTPEEVITALNSSATKVNIIVDEPMTMPATLDIASGKDITMVVNADMTFTGNNQIKVNKNARLTIEPGSGTISSANATTVFIDGGEAVINGGTFESASVHAIGVKNHGVAVINGGSFTGQECAVGGVVNGAVVTINGGTFNTRDNSVIGGNGTHHDDDAVEINIHGGTLTGNITTAGYVANAVYLPNRGTVNIDGGTLIADGGPAIVMRGGTLNISGDANIEARGTSGTAGKVGDAQFNIDLDGVALCYNTSYAGTDDIKLNITGGTITGVDHSIHVYNEIETAEKPFDINKPIINISGGNLNPPYSE